MPASASTPAEPTRNASSAPATPAPTSPPPVPTPSASAATGPTIHTTVDAIVHGAPITPALDSVAFADVATGWAAGSGVILGTVDGGQTWRRQWSGSGSISSLAEVDRRHVWGLAYGGTGDLGPTADRLVGTTNGGRTWTTTRLTGGFRGIAFSTDLTGWAVVGGISVGTTAPGRLEETLDAGRHWRASTLKARVDSVCFAGPSLGWAASGSGAYRTVDRGRRWSRVETGPNNALNAGWQATVRCRGSAAWVLWTGGAAAGSELYRVARTLDSGAHWKTVLSQLDDTLASLPAIDAYAGAFAPLSSTAAGFLGSCPACGPGSWSYSRTTDGGQTVRRSPLGGLTAGLNDITFSDATHGWIAGRAAGGFLLATDDAGRTWRRAYPSAASRPALDIAFVSPDVGFGLGIIGDARAILRTDDGGKTWRSIAELPADPAMPDRDPVLSFVDVRHGWVATARGLLATVDRGLTWRRVPNAPPGGVAFADRTHGCAGTFGTTAAMTVDGGATWEPINASQGLVACAASLVDPAWASAARAFEPGNLLALGSVVDATHAWAIGSVDANHLGLEATTDGGATWTVFRWPSPADGVGGLGADWLVRVSFASPTTGWLFTLFGRLYSTTDAGSTWHEITSR